MKSFINWVLYIGGVVFIVAICIVLNNIIIIENVEVGLGSYLIYLSGGVRLFRLLGDKIFKRK